MKKSPHSCPGPFSHEWGKGSLLRVAIMICLFFLSCTSSAENKIEHNTVIPEQQYSVYIMSRGIHTGIVIPVNTVSEESITALNFFKDYKYIDFGWGDEDYYQKPGGGKFCLGVKAVAVPTSSVMRVEGFNVTPEEMSGRSDYTVRFDLDKISFIKLCEYIDKSFRRDDSGRLTETSRRGNGGIIFFKSVCYYHIFNTCNRWAARGLQHAGLDVSSFMVITAGDLFSEVKRRGVVLKGGNN